MLDRSLLTEENFGILTDDDLALEATLVRPAELLDSSVGAVKVWVPKYPLTRSSLLPAARSEAAAEGSKSRTVQLAFDLRGSGESDGMPSAEGFEIDLNSIHEWAKERFGAQVQFQLLGFPDLGGATRLIALPLRPGVVAEFYRYNPDDTSQGIVLYFSAFRNFSRQDDALCRAIADRGHYTVYGADAMRFLLPAAPLTLEALWRDAATMVTQIGRPLYIVARSHAAGPALLMAAGAEGMDGVIVTGPAQPGLSVPGLFTAENQTLPTIARHINRLASRRVVFLWNAAEVGDTSPEHLYSIHNLISKSSLWGKVRQIDASILLNALGWLGGSQ